MPRKLWSVLGNQQRLDGGAMFGNVPKALWSKWFEADDANRIDLACRALLVQEADGRRILFETGIGAFFPPKLRARFGVHEANHVLIDNLAQLGVEPDDIDVIVLSHMHFDHAGGLLDVYADDRAPTLCFPRAQYVVGHAAWQRALQPHARDRASFIPELQPLIRATGRLEVVQGSQSIVLGPDYRMHYSDGHTPGLMLAEIPSVDGPIVFCGDLIPGSAWVHLPITMGYDRYPELLIDEKTILLDDLKARHGRLFFTHDPSIALARLGTDQKGRYCVEDPQSVIAGLVV
ncbi:MAG: MBL fold metallo-hydrolase [Myxococcota bacterium]|nr:MBL fold metallo-hydrolase [Myxococcota bacterium]